MQFMSLNPELETLVLLRYGMVEITREYLVQLPEPVIRQIFFSHITRSPDGNIRFMINAIIVYTSEGYFVDTDIDIEKEIFTALCQYESRT